MAIKTEELKDTAGVSEKNGTRGIQLLNDHFRNQDTAFTPEERRKHGLEGFLPHAYESLGRQAERVFQHLDVARRIRTGIVVVICATALLAFPLVFLLASNFCCNDGKAVTSSRSNTFDYRSQRSPVHSKTQ